MKVSIDVDDSAILATDRQPVVTWNGKDSIIVRLNPSAGLIIGNMADMRWVLSDITVVGSSPEKLKIVRAFKLLANLWKFL